MANTVAWIPIFLLTALFTRYNLSGDLTDGELARGLWMVAISPLFALVSLAGAASTRGGRRVEVGLIVVSALPLFPLLLVLAR